MRFDEIWGFIGKKDKHVTAQDSPDMGDVWTFCAIDADTKLVPAFRCGKRDHPKATLAYAWAHDTDDPKNPRLHVTVLHLHPIKSARDAVRAAIAQEFRLGTAEES